MAARSAGGVGAGLLGASAASTAAPFGGAAGSHGAPSGAAASGPGDEEEWVHVSDAVAKAREMRALVDDKMQPEAERLESEQREVEAQRKRYAELRDTLMAMKKGDGDGYEALVNLGNDIFAEAEVPDTRTVLVDVGLGFHAEFTRDEAIQFAASRVTDLQEKAEALAARRERVQTDIRIVKIALAQLAGDLGVTVPTPPPPPPAASSTR